MSQGGCLIQDLNWVRIYLGKRNVSFSQLQLTVQFFPTRIFLPQSLVRAEEIDAQNHAAGCCNRRGYAAPAFPIRVFRHASTAHWVIDSGPCNPLSASAIRGAAPCCSKEFKVTVDQDPTALLPVDECGFSPMVSVTYAWPARCPQSARAFGAARGRIAARPGCIATRVQNRGLRPLRAEGR